MVNVPPPLPRARAWTWAPWLAVLGAGIALHGWMSAPRTTVYQGRYFEPPERDRPAAVDPGHVEQLEDATLSDDACHSRDDRRHRRRHRRRRHRGERPQPATIDAQCTLGDHWTCTLDRDAVLALPRTHDFLSSQTRLVPSRQPDGTVAGVKLYGIRPDSIPDQLQFRNGDLLLSIDGVATGDLSELLAHLQAVTVRLEHGPVSVNVEVVRQGVTLQQTVRIE